MVAEQWFFTPEELLQSCLRFVDGGHRGGSAPQCHRDADPASAAHGRTRKPTWRWWEVESRGTTTTASRSGDAKDFEEWSVKLRSLVAAANIKVNTLMKSVEPGCTEEQLVKGLYHELTPDFTDDDSGFIVKTSAEMHHVFLNITTGEANGVVLRSLGSGWLAWKRLTSSLNPRTLASGIQSISAALNPQRITMALKADAMVNEWEDKVVNLPDRVRRSTVAQNEGCRVVLHDAERLSGKGSGCLCGCLGWDFRGGRRSVPREGQDPDQERGESPPRDARPEADGGGQERKLVADWSEDWRGGWGDVEEMTSKDDDHDHNHEEWNVLYIGKGDGKSKVKGGFQDNCFLCGLFLHPQAECRKGKGKGKGFGEDGFKGFGKDGYKGNFGHKCFGKDGCKGVGKDGWYGWSKGNNYGKGGPTLQLACIGCGATDHLLKDCPKNPNKIKLVQQEEDPVTKAATDHSFASGMSCRGVTHVGSVIDCNLTHMRPKAVVSLMCQEAKRYCAAKSKL